MRRQRERVDAVRVDVDLLLVREAFGSAAEDAHRAEGDDERRLRRVGPQRSPAFGGVDKIEPLWWSLSLGACLGGNATLVGASANLLVAGLGERNGVPFRFISYSLYAVPMTIVSIAICHVYLWWRFF